MPSSHDLAFPLIVIDFEATALTLESYPIEVGVAVAAGPFTPITTWSTLIAPQNAWDMTAQWDPDAQRVHGISRRDLRQGMSAREAMIALNDAVGPSDAWCDGGHYDAYWLETLANAAGVRPSFKLCDIGTLLAANPRSASRYREVLARQATPHRAGPDAALICAALAEAM